MKTNEVKEGDIFIMSKDKGYSPNQCKDGMQVMECCPLVMTVKTKEGCKTKPYNHFEKVTDTSGLDSVSLSPYFEDYRELNTNG